MDFLDILGISLTAIAAIASAGGLYLTFLNHRARKQSLLPTIEITSFAYVKDFYFFSLKTNAHSVGWKVVRIEAVHSDFGLEFLAQNYDKVEGNVTSGPYQTDWRSYCEYDGGPRPLEGFHVHRSVYEADLNFVCDTGSRVWWTPWRKRRIKLLSNFRRTEAMSTTNPLDDLLYGTNE